MLPDPPALRGCPREMVGEPLSTKRERYPRDRVNGPYSGRAQAAYAEADSVRA